MQAKLRRHLVISPSERMPQVLAAAAGGLLLGAASTWRSPRAVLLMMGVALIVWVVLKSPEIAILGPVVVTSTVLDQSQQPHIPLGFGTIYPYDLIIMSLLGIVFVRWLVEPQFRVHRTPISVPLLVFVSLSLLSTAAAILRGSTSLGQSLGEIRTISGYLLFFAVINLVQRKRQLWLLWQGFLLLATFVALAMIAQYLLGRATAILPGRVEMLVTGQASFAGVTRILPPGQSVVIVALISLLATMVANREQPVTATVLFQCVALGLAVVLTFSRNLWVGAGIALLYLFAITGRLGRQRFMRWFLALFLVATVLALSAAAAGPSGRFGALVGAASNRLLTLVSSETLGESSLRFRYIEYQYAIPQVLSHPVVGLGLGVSYRPRDSRLDPIRVDLSAYVHNGHVSVLLAAGWLGYLGLLWASVVFVVRGLTGWRRVGSPYLGSVVLGCALAYAAVVMVGSLTSPLFTESHWTTVIGLIMGVSEASLRIADGESGGRRNGR